MHCNKGQKVNQAGDGTPAVLCGLSVKHGFLILLLAQKVVATVRLSYGEKVPGYGEMLRFQGLSPFEEQSLQAPPCSFSAMLKQSSHTRLPQTGQRLKCRWASKSALSKAARCSLPHSIFSASSFSMTGLPSPVNGCEGLVHSFPHLSQKKLKENCPESEWSIDFFVNAFLNISKKSTTYNRAVYL